MLTNKHDSPGVQNKQQSQRVVKDKERQAACHENKTEDKGKRNAWFNWNKQ